MQEFKGPAATSELFVGMATALAAAVLSLHQLEAIEVTFLPLPVVAALRCVVKECKTDASTILGHEGIQRVSPEVWDLTKVEGVQKATAAIQRLASVKQNSVSSPITGSKAMAALSMALRCAASCSSSSRSTPLHVAAVVSLPEHGRQPICGSGGDLELVDGLIHLGSSLDARDTGGATALFLAAEIGSIPVVEHLLQAGADASLSNSAGESPIYIASLKGHVEVVGALVRSFVAQGVSWHRLRYADGWTPLMAAAVADHFEVASLHLSVVGEREGEVARKELVCAVNR